MSMVEVPLHAVAHGRAGDKGNRANVSIIAYDPNMFKVLSDQVTEEKVLKIFRHRGASGVKRYVLPNLNAFNFVIDDALEGGVNASLNADGHGKTLSFLLLGELMVRVPKASLPAGSPYL
jgi:hypothetical protein